MQLLPIILPYLLLLTFIIVAVFIFVKLKKRDKIVAELVFTSSSMLTKLDHMDAALCRMILDKGGLPISIDNNPALTESSLFMGDKQRYHWREFSSGDNGLFKYEVYTPGLHVLCTCSSRMDSAFVCNALNFMFEAQHGKT